MKIEITNEENNKTEAHSFKKKSIIVGRGKDCDIVLNTEGISRQHIRIDEDQDGNFTITDLGSSNGTFINDEKLEANVPTVFNMFFPARLGALVILGLVDDDGLSDKIEVMDETAAFLAQQGIKPVSSKPATKSKTSGTGSFKIEAPINGKNKIAGAATKRYAKAAPETKNKKKSPYLKLIIIALIGYAYWEFIVKEKIAPVEQPAQTTEKPTPGFKDEAPKVVKPSFKVPPSDLVTRKKCLDEIAQKVCNLVGKATEHEGAIFEDNTLYIVLNASRAFNILKLAYPTLNNEQEKQLLFAKAKNEVGLKFSEVLFIKAGHKASNISMQEYASYIIAHFSLNKSLLGEINNNEQINQLGIIVYRDVQAKPEVVNQALIEKNKLNELHLKPNQDILRIMRLAFNHGIKRDFIMQIRLLFHGLTL
jgi:pSer/pThr/pTyr-binding forkhead associated (FHA) protein